MTLRDKIVGPCLLCGGTGNIGSALCDCFIKFRAINRLIGGGYKEDVLDFVIAPGYKIPMIDSGLSQLNYFISNSQTVLSSGLGLFIFSKENGRGKTTLAHYLAYIIAKAYATTENYKRDRTYGFESVHTLFEKESRKMYDSEEELWKSTFYVIDDLGSEDRSASWKREGVISQLHRVLHYRRDLKLPTVFTSNYNPASISGFYAGVLDSVLEIKPDGTIGGQLYRQVEVGGAEDLRLVGMKSVWPA